MKSAYVEASFVVGATLISKFISWFGAGFFSHVDLVVPTKYCDANGLPRGSLLGARSDAIGGQPPGVRIRPPGYEVWSKRLVLRLACTQEQADRWWTFGLAQKGKPYDTFGLLGSFSGLWGGKRDWRADTDWWCSELAAEMGERGGLFKIPFPKYKVTPGDAAIAYAAAGGVPVLKIGMPT